MPSLASDATNFGINQDRQGAARASQSVGSSLFGPLLIGLSWEISPSVPNCKIFHEPSAQAPFGPNVTLANDHAGAGSRCYSYHANPAALPQFLSAPLVVRQNRPTDSPSHGRGAVQEMTS